MTDAATDTTAEDAKAEAPKAEAPKAKAAKAKAPKAKAAKAKAPKAEAAKAEAPEAEAAKAEAPKAEADKPAAPEAKPAKVLPPKKIDIQALQVDEEVTCWCGKCKTFRPHTVKTLQPPKPPKSVCLTCRAVHQVRLVEPGTKKARGDGPAMPDVAPWPELVAGVNPDDATKYAITGSYQVEDFVMHKLFGLGKVVQIGTMQRARISFEVGIKWMLQNHQA